MAKLCENGICTPKGFQASGIHCGIRKNRTKKDLALIYSEVPCNAAATYTLNSDTDVCFMCRCTSVS